MNKIKVLLITLIALTLLVTRAKPVLAIDLWPFDDLWNTVKCAADIDCTVRAASTSAGNFVVYNTVGKDFEDLEAVDIQAMQRGEWNKGLASAVVNVGAMAYANPPANVKDYLKTELANNLLNNPAQAQTAGTKALSPVLDAWSAMRNVAYGMFAIIMVAIGFMILFQQQLPTRTVVTFTYALPKILLGLVLITFSFPIIALIIDVGAVFLPAVVLQLFSGLFKTVTSTAGGIASVFSGSHLAILGSMLEGIARVPLEPLPALFIVILFILVFLVIAGYAVVRLIINYAILLLSTIFSPFVFLLGTLPGQEGQITSFLKGIAARTLVFPAIFFLVLLSAWMAIESLVVPSEFLEENYGTIVTGNFANVNFIGAFLSLVVLGAVFIVPGQINNALGVGGKKK